MLILGIDPGTATTGFGLIEVKKNVISVLDFGLVETDKLTQPGKRLIQINSHIKRLLLKHRPDAVAIEKLFFATNAKTAMGVGQAIGVIVYTVAKEGYSLFEYSPGTIKKVVAGDGRADKKMVQKSLRELLGARVRSRAHQKTHFDNAADGLAVAVCHAKGVIKSG